MVDRIYSVKLEIKDTTDTARSASYDNKMISIFPLWIFQLYIATIQQHLLMGYLSIGRYDIPDTWVRWSKRTQHYSEAKRKAQPPKWGYWITQSIKYITHKWVIRTHSKCTLNTHKRVNWYYPSTLDSILTLFLW